VILQSKKVNGLAFPLEPNNSIGNNLLPILDHLGPLLFVLGISLLELVRVSLFAAENLLVIKPRFVINERSSLQPIFISKI